MPDANLDCLRAYYRGETVTEYERRRESQPAWHAERRALESFLATLDLPPGSRVLDIPVGTGRFLPIYARNRLRAIGVDVSEDMIRAARRRCADLGLRDPVITMGQVEAIHLHDRSVELVVCVRFLVHMDLLALRRIVAELARVSSRYLIAHVRIASGGKAIPGVPPPAESALRCVLASAPRLLRRLAAPHRPCKDKVASKGSTIHREEAVREEFDRLALQVIREEVVNRAHDDGYESRMFLLACSK